VSQSSRRAAARRPQRCRPSDHRARGAARPATDGGDQLASQPTMCTPAQLDAVVAATMKILAASVIELAALKVWKSL
jgi:hypothetical protein